MFKYLLLFGLLSLLSATAKASDTDTLVNEEFDDADAAVSAMSAYYRSLDSIGGLVIRHEKGASSTIASPLYEASAYKIWASRPGQMAVRRYEQISNYRMVFTDDGEVTNYYSGRWRNFWQGATYGSLSRVQGSGRAFDSSAAISWIVGLLMSDEPHELMRLQADEITFAEEPVHGIFRANAGIDPYYAIELRLSHLFKLSVGDEWIVTLWISADPPHQVRRVEQRHSNGDDWVIITHELFLEENIEVPKDVYVADRPETEDPRRAQPGGRFRDPTEQPLADVEMQGLDGQSLEIKDLRGSAVLVFWASWAHDSNRTLQQLIELEEEYGDDGINVYGINIGASEEKVKAVSEQHGIDSSLMLILSRQDARILGVRSPGEMWLIDGAANEVSYVHRKRSLGKLRNAIGDIAPMEEH